MADTRNVLNLPGERLAALEAAINGMISSLVTTGMIAHHGTDDLITSADASDLATSKTLTAELATWLPAHGANTNIHTAAGTIATAAAWTSTPGEPADLTEVQNVLNELKTDWNGHIVDTAAHRGVLGPISGDGVLAPMMISTANATDQSTANALANALKSAFNIHGQSGVPSIVLVNS
jgi:hypothetical protein